MQGNMMENRKTVEAPFVTNSCAFYIERKKRFCKMVPGSGRKFCVEHAVSEELTDQNRISCPYDSKHSCYVRKLQKHLKKCNARPKPLPAYISQNINSADSSYPDAGQFDHNYSIGTVSDDFLLDLVKRIENIYEQIPECRESIRFHDIVQTTVNEYEQGTAKKHLLQNSSLLKNIEDNDLLDDNMTFVEFGAGRGSLTYWLSQALDSKENCSVVLIDKASHRHKSDNKLKSISELNILRIRADIADLDLTKIPLLQSSANRVVGVCKHLCGMATDLAFRCLINAELNNFKIKGVVMAPCCHHRCTWSTFIGKQYLLENGFEPQHFTTLCSITSWATCGYGKSGSGMPLVFNQLPDNDRYRRLSLTQDMREEIGRKCKTLLNYARLIHLEKTGFTGKLIYYVDRVVSPENMCIIAKN